MEFLLTCEIFDLEIEYDNDGYEQRKMTILETFDFSMEVKLPVDFKMVECTAKETVWEDTGCHMVEGTLRLKGVV